MGKLQRLNCSKTSADMDIDPRPTSWNSLCPTFIDSRRTKLLQEESGGHVIGSPPSAASPKVLWNESFQAEVPKLIREGTPSRTSGDSPMDESDLTSRVKDIRLQPPQPMIICENIDDPKMDSREVGPRNPVSLAVPAVDLSEEKKRPPLSAPY